MKIYEITTQNNRYHIAASRYEDALQILEEIESNPVVKFIRFINYKLI